MSQAPYYSFWFEYKYLINDIVINIRTTTIQQLYTIYICICIYCNIHILKIINGSICLAFDWFDAQHQLVRHCWKAVAKTNQGRWGMSENGKQMGCTAQTEWGRRSLQHVGVDEDGVLHVRCWQQTASSIRFWTRLSMLGHSYTAHLERLYLLTGTRQNTLNKENWNHDLPIVCYLSATCNLFSTTIDVPTVALGASNCANSDLFVKSRQLIVSPVISPCFICLAGWKVLSF